MTTAALNELTPEADARFGELVRAGRDNGPEMLFRWWRLREIETPVLRELICDVWSAAERPTSRIGQNYWLDMWTAAGFCSEGGASAPTAPLTLWRADMRAGRGMSWTSNIETARWFADRESLFSLHRYGLDVHIPCPVYEARVPPAAVLACIDGPDSRGESEVVVNPRRLRGRWAPNVIETRLRGG